MRYIDADKLAEYEEHAWDWDTVNGIETATALRQVISDIRHEPKAEVCEVVRCKDCKHARVHDYAPAECQYYCTLAVNYHTKDFFCALGERREDVD